MLSKYEIRTRTVQLLAPTLCGFFISVNLFSPYILTLVISIISLFFLYKLNFYQDKNEVKTIDGVFQSIKEALIWLKNKPEFRKIVLLTSINNFLHPILYLTIIYQLKIINIGFDIMGYILSGLGIGGIIGSFISSYLLKLTNFNILLISVNILRIFVFLGFVIFPTPWGYFIFFIFKAILGGIWNVCYNIYTINEMPHTYVARVSALSGLVIKVFSAIAGLIAGYLIKYFGVTPTLYFLILLTIGMFLYTINIKRYEINI